MKRIFIFFASLFISGNISVSLASGDDDFEKVLSASYGSDVKTEISEEKCEVRYSQVPVEEEIAEDVQGASSDDETSVKTKKVITNIPETIAQCEKTENFKDYSQYKVSITSPNKFIAQLYNTLKLPIVKNLNIKSYNEDMMVVPSLGLVSFQNLDVEDVDFTEQDATTGLKSEIGNLKSYKLQQQFTENGGIITHNIKNSLSGLNVVLPFFSLQINSENQEAESEYTISANDSFNYQQIMSNLVYLNSSTSKLEGNGIKIGVDMLDFGINFDIKAKNDLQSNNKETVKLNGNMIYDNIVFNGDLVSKEKQVKKITMQYSVTDIPMEDFVELSKIPVSMNFDFNENEDFIDGEDNDITTQELSENDEDYGEKMALILDNMAKKARMLSVVDFQFANADIEVKTLTYVKNGYLTGASKVKVTNLFNIFPQQKQCVNNPKASQIAECMSDVMFLGLQGLIDTTKNDSLTVYKFTEKGVFKNNKKISDPIEINFQKMYKESNQEDDNKITQQ